MAFEQLHERGLFCANDTFVFCVFATPVNVMSATIIKYQPLHEETKHLFHQKRKTNTCHHVHAFIPSFSFH